MSDKIEFAAETIAHLSGLAERATARPWDSGAEWVFFAGEYDAPRARLKAICHEVEQEDADYIAAAANHLPAALDEIERLQGEVKRQRDRIARLHQTIKNLCGLEEGTHYRCSGCDEIYEKPPASIVPISEDHTAKFCPECSEE
jgi:HAMP domain-containing protein